MAARSVAVFLFLVFSTDDADDGAEARLSKSGQGQIEAHNIGACVYRSKRNPSLSPLPPPPPPPLSVPARLSCVCVCVCVCVWVCVCVCARYLFPHVHYDFNRRCHTDLTGHVVTSMI